jgi:hypothetical protein
MSENLEDEKLDDAAGGKMQAIETKDGKFIVANVLHEGAKNLEEARSIALGVNLGRPFKHGGPKLPGHHGHHGLHRGMCFEGCFRPGMPCDRKDGVE